MTPATALALLALVAPPRCGEPAAARAFDAGLFCLPLLPAASAEGASGQVTLRPAPSPFGLAATAAGVPELVLEVEAAGLPPLAPPAGYVAWAVTPMFTREVRLGALRAGRVTSGPVALAQFLVLVTAEPDARGTARRGRPVLRGTSPSMVLQPHGANALPPRALAAAHAHHARPSGWTMPPMHPLAPTMPPGLEQLEPAVAPWLPEGAAASLPEARAPEATWLAPGDTLELVAAPARRTVRGQPVVAYAYNGQLPGPVLHVRQGARVFVRFVNRTALPGAVHWHGLRLVDSSDGAVGLTQAAVPPGGSFLYTLDVPDAGTFWYHPHAREDAAQDLGLAAMLVVHGADDADAPRRVHRDLALLLDDLLLGDDGPIPWGREAATHALMGRVGNVLTVNGTDRWRLAARRGEVVRLRFANAANARVFNVSLPGARLRLVATDLGPYAREHWVDHVTIAPGERYVVDARFEAPGAVPLVNRVTAPHPASRGFLEVVDTLGVVEVGDEPAPPLAAPFALAERPAVARAHARAARAARGAAARALLLTLRLDTLPFGLVQAMRLDTAWVMPVEWAGLMPMMDWLPTAREVRWVLRDEATGRENRTLDWAFPAGARLRLRVANDRHTLHPMAHPFHLHGQRFLVLARNGVPERDLAWKDTILVPPGTSVELLVELDNPGRWMFHCHIAEHIESGMHGALTVLRPGERAPALPHDHSLGGH